MSVFYAYELHLSDKYKQVITVINSVFIAEE